MVTGMNTWKASKTPSRNHKTSADVHMIMVLPNSDQDQREAPCVWDAAYTQHPAARNEANVLIASVRVAVSPAQ